MACLEPEDPLKAPWQQHLRGARQNGAESAWVPDTAVLACMSCQARFGVLRRRHHCRRCGAVVCDDCSGNRMAAHLIYGHAPPASKDAEERVRICDACARVVDYRIKKKLQARGFRRGRAAVNGDESYQSLASLMGTSAAPTPPRNPLSQEKEEPEAEAQEDPEETARKELERERYRQERAAFMRRLRAPKDAEGSEDSDSPLRDGDVASV